jgi:hypothetical protein
MHDEDVSGKDTDRERMRARDHARGCRGHDAWVRYADMEDHDLAKESELVNIILLAIRKDLLGKTKVTKEHLENLTRPVPRPSIWRSVWAGFPGP